MGQEGIQTNPSGAQQDRARQHFDRGLRLVAQARLGLNPEDRRSAFLAAASEFERALEQDAGYPGARTNLGYCLIELGRYGDAKREIERAISDAPQDVSARINYAIILKHEQQIEQAESYLRQALAMDPQRGSTYRDLGYLLNERGYFRRAADYLERYLELTPHANDQRAVRERIRLLRQRAEFFELPDRWITHLGVTADLRRRAAATLLDSMVYAAFWLMMVRLLEHVPWAAIRQMPMVLSMIYVYQVVTTHVFGGSIGKMMTNIIVKHDASVSWYDPITARETLRLGPVLIGLLLPRPWNVAIAVLAILWALLSALRHREGRAWYDHVTGCYAVESQHQRRQITAWLVWLLCLIAGVLTMLS